MKVKLFFLYCCVSTFLFSACGEKEDCCVNPPFSVKTGIYVVNEGPFGGTGTISWYNPETGEVQDSLYEKANNGAELGQFVQSLSFHDGKAYIVVNGANRVVVVDAETFSYLDTIGGLALPRYFLPIDNQTALVSQWGADGLTGSVAKIDLNTLQIIKTIPTGAGPDKMLRQGNEVWVANSGGYGVDASLTSISLSNDQSQTQAIPSGKNPSTMASYNQQLYYLCKGYFLDSNPTGWFNFIGNSEAGFEVPAYSDDLVVDTDNGNFYFIGGGQVYRANAVNFQNSLTTLFAQSAYGLGFDADLNLLYCADAKDFSSPGEVVIYQTDGTRVGAFRTGVAPGEVLIVQ